jgi:hypothetical protein
MAVALPPDTLGVCSVILDGWFVQGLVKAGTVKRSNWKRKSQLMEPLDKLAELARAHWTKHEEGCAVVESALSPNVREPCVQCRVVCRSPFQWQ